MKHLIVGARGIPTAIRYYLYLRANYPLKLRELRGQMNSILFVYGNELDEDEMILRYKLTIDNTHASFLMLMMIAVVVFGLMMFLLPFGQYPVDMR